MSGILIAWSYLKYFLSFLWYFMFCSEMNIFMEHLWMLKRRVAFKGIILGLKLCTCMLASLMIFFPLIIRYLYDIWSSNKIKVSVLFELWIFIYFVIMQWQLSGWFYVLLVRCCRLLLITSPTENFLLNIDIQTFFLCLVCATVQKMMF